MKEFIKKDIGDFFLEKTEGFEKEPPSFIWENIQSKIQNPNFVSKGVKKHFFDTWYSYLIIIGTGLSLISTFVLYQHFNNPVISENNINTEKQITVSSPIDNSVITTQPEAINTENINSNTVSELNENNTENKPVVVKEQVNEAQNKPAEKSGTEKKLYNLSASEFSKILAISIVDSNNKEYIRLTNPTSNMFGYYEIDISRLNKGQYTIRIQTESGWKDYKKEDF